MHVFRSFAGTVIGVYIWGRGSQGDRVEFESTRKSISRKEKVILRLLIVFNSESASRDSNEPCLQAIWEAWESCACKHLRSQQMLELRDPEIEELSHKLWHSQEQEVYREIPRYRKINMWVRTAVCKVSIFKQLCWNAEWEKQLSILGKVYIFQELYTTFSLAIDLVQVLIPVFLLLHTGVWLPVIFFAYCGRHLEFPWKAVLVGSSTRTVGVNQVATFYHPRSHIQHPCILSICAPDNFRSQTLCRYRLGSLSEKKYFVLDMIKTSE
jgi:hypothetical protein